MPTPCDPRGDKRWVDFEITPTGETTATRLGHLVIDTDTDGIIRGHREEPTSPPMRREEFGGICRDIEAGRHLMIFQMLIGGSLYCFAGTITGATSPTPRVSGIYFRVATIGLNGAAGLAADPGDTGGWGGNQGGD